MALLGWLGLLLAFLAFPSSVYGQEKDAALLKKTVNQVEVKRKEALEWQGAQTNAYLHNLDTIRTLRDSRAEVQFPDLSLTRLAPLTYLEISVQDRSVRLEIGKIFLKVFKGAKPMRVITPAAVAATVSWEEKPAPVASFNLKESYLAQAAESEGGTELLVIVNEKGETEFQVLAGEIYMVAPTFQGLVNEGQKIEIRSDGTTAGPQILDVVQARKENQDIVSEIGAAAAQTPAGEPQAQPQDQSAGAADQGPISIPEVLPPPPIEPTPTTSPVNITIF